MYTQYESNRFTDLLRTQQGSLLKVKVMGRGRRQLVLPNVVHTNTAKPPMDLLHSWQVTDLGQRMTPIEVQGHRLKVKVTEAEIPILMYTHNQLGTGTRMKPIEGQRSS